MTFIDMNTYILTEGRNFKTFLKGIYTTALEFFSHLLVTKCWTWNWTLCFDSGYGTCGILNFTVDSMNTLQLKQMMKPTFVMVNKNLSSLSVIKRQYQARWNKIPNVLKNAATTIWLLYQKLSFLQILRTDST